MKILGSKCHQRHWAYQWHWTPADNSNVCRKLWRNTRAYNNIMTFFTHPPHPRRTAEVWHWSRLGVIDSLHLEVSFSVSVFWISLNQWGRNRKSSAWLEVKYYCSCFPFSCFIFFFLVSAIHVSYLFIICLFWFSFKHKVQN